MALFHWPYASAETETRWQLARRGIMTSSSSEEEEEEEEEREPVDCFECFCNCLRRDRSSAFSDWEIARSFSQRRQNKAMSLGLDE